MRSTAARAMVCGCTCCLNALQVVEQGAEYGVGQPPLQAAHRAFGAFAGGELAGVVLAAAVVEALVGQRDMAMRTDKQAHNYQAGLLLGAIVMWTPV